jgi:hypothetical protein
MSYSLQPFVSLQGCLKIPDDVQERKVHVKKVPRVLYGKQQGWTFDLAILREVQTVSSPSKLLRRESGSLIRRSLRRSKNTDPASLEIAANVDLVSKSQVFQSSGYIRMEHPDPSAAQQQQPSPPQIGSKKVLTIFQQATGTIAEPWGNGMSQRSVSLPELESSSTDERNDEPCGDDETRSTKLELAARTCKQVEDWEHFLRNGRTQQSVSRTYVHLGFAADRL